MIHIVIQRIERGDGGRHVVRVVLPYQAGVNPLRGTERSVNGKIHSGAGNIEIFDPVIRLVSETVRYDAASGYVNVCDVYFVSVHYGYTVGFQKRKQVHLSPVVIFKGEVKIQVVPRNVGYDTNIEPHALDSVHGKRM